MSAETPEPIAPNANTLSSPAILLLGEPGAGKTFSLATTIRPGTDDRLVYLYTDPGGDESLMDALEYYKVPLRQVYFRHVPPASQGWSGLLSMADQINKFNYESLSSMKNGVDKQSHRQIYELISVLGDFKCQRTNRSLGDASTWGNDTIFALDSLSGVNTMAKDGTVGAKPTLHKGEWGTAMALEEAFIRKVVSGIKCRRILIGHLDKVMDEVAGRMMFSVALLGNKLAPKIPHLFSDVILAKRGDGGKHLWATTDPRISLKYRNLPSSDSLEPSFAAIWNKWEARKKRVRESLIDEAKEQTKGLDMNEISVMPTTAAPTSSAPSTASPLTGASKP